MELKEPFKLDKKGLWYLDSHDINTTETYFYENNKSPHDRIPFYLIDGMDDYIIKDSTKYPYFFNRIRNLQLLRKLVEKQDKIPNVDFPVAYYKDYGILRGIVVPYYKDAISLGHLFRFFPLNALKEYYNHENNDVDNLISLLLDVLELIRSMYENGVYYLDIRSGNFVLYNNNVKVIDFEPGYILFKDRNNWYYNRMLENYGLLVRKICYRLEKKDIGFNFGDSFIETERNVKELSKRIER